VCCLRPGVPGLSDNIRIASIVGRFLEHSRVYMFENGGEEEIYLGSADIMHRNLDRRVEVLFPIENKQHRLRIQQAILTNALADNMKIRWLQADGNYRCSDNKVPPHNFQENLLLKHCSAAKHPSPRT